MSGGCVVALLPTGRLQDQGDRRGVSRLAHISHQRVYSSVETLFVFNSAGQRLLIDPGVHRMDGRNRIALFEPVQNHLNGSTRPCDNWLAAHNLWIRRDEGCHSCLRLRG